MKRLVVPLLGIVAVLELVGLGVMLWPMDSPEPISLTKPAMVEIPQEAGVDTSEVPLIVYLTDKYDADPDLIRQLVEWADTHDHGTMILAIMAVESRFQPEVVSRAGACGLGQVMAGVHLDPYELKSARGAGRPTIVDECGIESKDQLFEPELNFCATGVVYGSLLERRGSVEQALWDYVGSRGEVGKAYAKKVLRVHKGISTALER